MAALCIVDSRHDVDPYSYAHSAECTGATCRDEGGLVDRDELGEDFLNCPGCASEYSLFSEFARRGLDLSLYDRVMAAFSVAGMIERFGYTLDQIDAPSARDMLIVTGEQARYETQQMINASKGS